MACNELKFNKKDIVEIALLVSVHVSVVQIVLLVNVNIAACAYSDARVATTEKFQFIVRLALL